MGEPLGDGDRVWFYDTRTSARRMGVSTYPDAGVVVISLWSGEVCTGTFRLLLADAARVIGVLADGLAVGVRPASVNMAAPTSWLDRLAQRFGWQRQPRPLLRRVK